MTEKDKSTFENVVLIAIVAITVSQFSVWGYKLVIFMLGAMFGVEVPEATIFTSLVGALAIVGSVLIVIGTGYWIAKKWEYAAKMVVSGTVFFMGKNLLDIFDGLLVFQQTVATPELHDIQRLAADIGVEIMQLAFWVFVAIYIHNRSKALLSKGTMPADQQV